MDEYSNSIHMKFRLKPDVYDLANRTTIRLTGRFMWTTVYTRLEDRIVIDFKLVIHRHLGNRSFGG